MNSFKADEFVQQLMAKLAVDDQAVPNYTWKDGIIRYKNRIWIGQDPALHSKIIAAFHGSTIGGHCGVLVTFKRMKQIFAWKGMKNSVHAFVQSCLVCQQANQASRFIATIACPYNDCILVVVDTFSKYAHLYPCNTPLLQHQ